MQSCAPERYDRALRGRPLCCAQIRHQGDERDAALRWLREAPQSERQRWAGQVGHSSARDGSTAALDGRMVKALAAPCKPDRDRVSADPARRALAESEGEHVARLRKQQSNCRARELLDLDPACLRLELLKRRASHARLRQHALDRRLAAIEDQSEGPSICAREHVGYSVAGCGALAGRHQASSHRPS
jgi:hypothetical protein